MDTSTYTHNPSLPIHMRTHFDAVGVNRTLHHHRSSIRISTNQYSTNITRATITTLNLCRETLSFMPGEAVRERGKKGYGRVQTGVNKGVTIREHL